MATPTSDAPFDAAFADSGNDATESVSASASASAHPSSTATASTTAPSADFLLHVAQQINQGFQSSLSKVVADISHEYGIASSPLEEKGDDAFDLTAALQREPPSSDDLHRIIHELQALRRRQRELQQRVDDLQSEQRLAAERAALYAELTQQLKRELVNERVAHAQTKKEASAQTTRTQQQQQRLQQQRRDSGDEKPPALALTSSDNDDDPWSSPGKTTGGSAGAATSNILSFSSFYQSPRLLSAEDEPSSPMSSTGGSGLQPLRGSMMDQFLPSSLLDSPQITPSSKSFGRKDDSNDESSSNSRLAFASEITKGLGAFSLLEPPCAQCKQQPQSECAPCGHQLCANCDAGMLVQPESERECPRCHAAVSAVKDLQSGQLRVGDNQREHFLRADASSEAEPKQSGTTSPRASGADASADASTVSSVTLSLMAELFDTIPLEQLEAALKAAAGQAPRAIEKLLETHPSFYPGGTSRRSSSSASQSQSPVPPGQKSGAAHRGVSASTSNQAGAAAGGSGSSAAANWKTEMCMYYLQGKCNKTRRTCSFAHGESDLVRPSSAKHAAAVGFKTRMCPLFLEGACPKSRRDCPLAHGESDLREGLVALASSAALPAAAPRLQSYKTELCYYYLKGCCNYTKEECRFAHGESDLRTVESNTLEWTAKLVGAGEFPPSVGGGASSMSMSGADKHQLQHQHQYQQQYQQQFASPPQPQQPPPSQQLQHTSPAFTPAHQMPLQHALPPHHQFAAFQPHMPPPHLPMQHGHHHPQQQQQQQQGMYHGGQQAHQFRYGMDSGKRSARPPQPPRRDSASWSSGYDASSGADF